MGADGGSLQRPHFLQFGKVLLLVSPGLAQFFCVIQDGCVQYIFMDAVGGAEAFTAALISQADVFDRAVPAPAAKNRHKGVSALGTAEEAGVSVRRLPRRRRPRLLPEKGLNPFPVLPFYDRRVEVFVPIPFF